MTHYLNAVSGTWTDFDLASFCFAASGQVLKTGDKVAVELAGNLVINSIIPPEAGFWCWFGIRDVDGGEWSITFKDKSSGTAGNLIVTPGAPESTDVGPDFVMSSGEDWTAIGVTDAFEGEDDEIDGGWRILCRNSNFIPSQLSVGGGGIPGLLDDTFSPQWAYNFQENGNDVSGNGLTLNTGSPTYHDVVPQRAALKCPGIFSRGTTDAALNVLGDYTVVGFIKRSAAQDTTIAAFGNSDGTDSVEANNHSWELRVTSTHQLAWFSESGTGVNVTGATSTGNVVVPVDTICMVAGVRESNVVKFYLNGRLIHTTGTLTAPTGGSAGLLGIGSSNTLTILSAAGYAAALSAAQIKALYNKVMGPAFGFLA